MWENNGWEVGRDYGWSMDEEQMTMDEYGWKLVQNGWRMDEKRLEKCVEMNNKWKKKDVQKNHFRRILDYLPQKTALGSQTWNDVYFCYCGQIVFENQLCVSCARIPILCSVSQTCFDWQARCFVTFQLLILSFPNEKKVQKRGILAPRVETATFRIPPAISKRSFYVSVRYYIYICVRDIYIYMCDIYIYICVIYIYVNIYQ